MTPDSHPLIGVTPVQDFYLLTGFSGHGFMHSPVFGKLMAELVAEGEAHTVEVSFLVLSRFADLHLVYEYNVIWKPIINHFLHLTSES